MVGAVYCLCFGGLFNFHLPQPLSLDIFIRYPLRSCTELCEKLDSPLPLSPPHLPPLHFKITVCKTNFATNPPCRSSASSQCLSSSLLLGQGKGGREAMRKRWERVSFFLVKCLNCESKRGAGKKRDPGNKFAMSPK